MLADIRGEGPRARAVGLWAAAGFLAIAGGPLIGGALIAGVGWHGLFLINLPFGLLGSWLVHRYAPRSGRAEWARLDVPCQIVAVLSLTFVVGALTEVSAVGWGSPWIAAALLVGAALFAGFVVMEERSAYPMMPLAMFHDLTFSGPPASAWSPTSCSAG